MTYSPGEHSAQERRAGVRADEPEPGGTCATTLIQNLAYAKYAVNGDYANAIAGINARIQDAQTIAPTTSGQVER